jgi:zinc transporter ZupT
MIGTIVGILLQGFAGDSLIYLTAGGFIYLACVNILPELLDDSAFSSLKFRMFQLLCFAIGVGFLW